MIGTFGGRFRVPAVSVNEHFPAFGGLTLIKQRKRLVKDGTAILSVYCLKTDSWNDYLAFMQDAQTANTEGRIRDVNRFLRTAITCLFSHFEGVVNDIFEQKSIPAKRHSLCEKAWAVARAAECYTPIPFVNFRLEKILVTLLYILG